jgi:hypothetical protein
MGHRLQPLRIPTGWTVAFNDGLYEVDPDAVGEEDRYTFLKEDLLQMVHERFGRVLDVGWYPSGNIEEGAYGLHVHEGDWDGKLLFRLSTRDRAELVKEIERLLQDISDGRM